MKKVVLDLIAGAVADEFKMTPTDLAKGTKAISREARSYAYLSFRRIAQTQIKEVMGYFGGSYAHVCTQTLDVERDTSEDTAKRLARIEANVAQRLARVVISGFTHIPSAKIPFEVVGKVNGEKMKHCIKAVSRGAAKEKFAATYPQKTIEVLRVSERVLA